MRKYMLKTDEGRSGHKGHCLECGVEFYRKRYRWVWIGEQFAEYCSNKCRQKAYRKRIAKANPGRRGGSCGSTRALRDSPGAERNEHFTAGQAFGIADVTTAAGRKRNAKHSTQPVGAASGSKSKTPANMPKAKKLPA